MGIDGHTWAPPSRSKDLGGALSLLCLLSEEGSLNEYPYPYIQAIESYRTELFWWAHVSKMPIALTAVTLWRTISTPGMSACWCRPSPPIVSGRNPSGRLGFSPISTPNLIVARYRCRQPSAPFSSTGSWPMTKLHQYLLDQTFMARRAGIPVCNKVYMSGRLSPWEWYFSSSWTASKDYVTCNMSTRRWYPLDATWTLNTWLSMPLRNWSITNSSLVWYSIKGHAMSPRHCSSSTKEYISSDWWWRLEWN